MTTDDVQKVRTLQSSGGAPTGRRCCVFQPFDNGPHDKRFDELLKPAIQATGLEAYRIDRDDGAVIPIETLHDQIRSAAVCVADISTRNPNVMYELGFAIASGKDVVIICSTSQADKFPFDIQHRGIILYNSDSLSDFQKLQGDITNRINVLLQRQVTTEEIASASPIKDSAGLRPHEFAALAFVISHIDGNDGIFSRWIKEDMQKAGFTVTATQLGLIRLTRLGYLEAYETEDNNGYTVTAYRLTSIGEDWLLANQDKLQLRIIPRRTINTEGITDEDVPF